MNRIIQLSLIIAVFVFSAFQANAQKIGHIDAQSIVLDMPEFKQARANLDGMATQFKKQLEQQQEKIKARLLEADKKYQRGELTPKEQAEIEAELQAENQKLQQNEQKYQSDLLKKEEELTAPLYKKIRGAIKTVAQEKGYKYVLEAANLLYAEDQDDITAAVKSKLGM